MGLIGKIIKVSLPTAAVYYSYEIGLWRPGVGSKEDVDRVAQQRNQIGTIKNQVCQTVDPYMKPVTDQLNLSKLKFEVPSLACVACLWNAGIKRTFRALADFQPGQAVDKLVKMINEPSTKPTETVTTSPKAIESTKPKETAV